jgi:4-hydroxybenzoyl-CoA thioesterase
MKMAKAFSVEVPIRFSNCDPAGIVYFPEFFDMINSLVEDWFTIGMDTSSADLMMRSHIGTPTIDIQCEFIKPCRYGERLRLELAVTKIGRTSFHLTETGTVAGELRWRTRHVLCFLSTETYRPVPIPPGLREKMARFM